MVVRSAHVPGPLGELDLTFNKLWEPVTRRLTDPKAVEDLKCPWEAIVPAG